MLPLILNNQLSELALLLQLTKVTNLVVFGLCWQTPSACELSFLISEMGEPSPGAGEKKNCIYLPVMQVT